VTGSPRGKLAALTVVTLAAVAFPALVAAPWLRVALDPSAPSLSRGTVNSGSLEHGRTLPPWGAGFVTYSFLGAALGRQYVHEKVRDALVAAFTAHARLEPGRRFVTGETGWPGGGRIRPHRSHENGMSVDVFMPVDGPDGSPGTWRRGRGTSSATRSSSTPPESWATCT
jgi:penicillin-insensitive murein endopeptidase